MTSRREVRAPNLHVVSLLAVFLPALLLAARLASATDWRAAVDPALLAAAAEPGPMEFILVLREQADLSPAAALDPKEAKGTYVYNTLTEVAAASQREILASLAANNAHHRSFWVVNAIWVRGDAGLLSLLAARDDVQRITANPPLRQDVPMPDPAAMDTFSTAAVEWNVQQIGAPVLWDMAITGKGVVIGGQDTGYQWDHPALKSQYRGWSGSSVDHDYNWRDAIHFSSGPCGANAPAPCDDHGHGTHTMGTMVGDDGAGNRIGVAPDARWIGCRNMDGGFGTPATYLECFQWFIAPTRIGGADPDPSKAPHIINNSWSCPPFEGCTDPDILRQAVEAVRAAGILTVQSAGNSGPNCATINTPAAIYDATFTVGAADSAGQIARFSSRGPVLVDDSARPKPNVVAPGVSVRSSTRGDGYTTLSGTSMAAPHVAGLAALLISANPELAGDVDRLEQLMTLSAVRHPTNQECYGLAGDGIPNAVYGYGHVDAPAAVRFAAGSRIWYPLVAYRPSAETVPDKGGG